MASNPVHGILVRHASAEETDGTLCDVSDDTVVPFRVLGRQGFIRKIILETSAKETDGTLCDSDDTVVPFRVLGRQGFIRKIISETTAKETDGTICESDDTVLPPRTSGRHGRGLCGKSFSYLDLRKCDARRYCINITFRS